MRKYFCVFVILISLFILIYSANFYFLSRLSSTINKGYQIKVDTDNVIEPDFSLPENLFDKSNIKTIYKNKNPKYDRIKSKILKNFIPCDAKERNYSELWEEVNSWVNNNEIYGQYDQSMCQALKALENVTIIAATNSHRGTQLKLDLLIEGNQTVFFKPAWYDRHQIIEGPIYSGKDRHNSEIIAFYLGALLDIRWTPIAVGRSINLKDVWTVGDKELQESMLVKKNESRLCLYGKCYYCKKSEVVCGNRTHFIEGVILFKIPGPLVKQKSPWQRTYKEGKKALWQKKSEDNYCNLVKEKLSNSRILDLIDAAIFDFLIQNGDRHHYETRMNRVVLIDNGKGFGNPYDDFIDILAPLYQCCIIRKTTYSRLLVFTGGSLTEILKQLTKNDLLYPILTESHFAALERRLLITFSVIEFCRNLHGNQIFR